MTVAVRLLNQPRALEIMARERLDGFIAARPDLVIPENAVINLDMPHTESRRLTLGNSGG